MLLCYEFIELLFYIEIIELIDFDYDGDKIKAPVFGALLLEVPSLRAILQGVCLCLCLTAYRDSYTTWLRCAAYNQNSVFAFCEVMSEHKTSYKEGSTITENNT